MAFAPSDCSASLPPGATAPSVAQIPSVLEEVKLVTEDRPPGVFLLRFSPREPDFAAINDNPSQPDLLMRSAAARAARRRPRPAIAASCARRGFDDRRRQSADALRHGRAGAGHRRDRSATTVKVTVERVSEAEATGIQPIGSGGDVVVPASDLAAASSLYNRGRQLRTGVPQICRRQRDHRPAGRGRDDPAQQHLHPPRAGLRVARDHDPAQLQQQPEPGASSSSFRSASRSATAWPSIAASTRSGSPARPTGSRASRRRSR